MEFCPVCRHRDPSCKIRLLRGLTFFSCKSCFDGEERKLPPPSRWPSEPETEPDQVVRRLLGDSPVEHR